MNAYYVDTSVLTAFYCRESGSDKAEKILRGSKQLTLSNLVKLELASAISKKVRTGDFDTNFARQLISLFHSHIHGGYYEVISISDSDLVLAEEWVSSFSTLLRALDAIHLAVAFHNERELLTADQALSLAAKELHVPCRLL